VRVISTFLDESFLSGSSTARTNGLEADAVVEDLAALGEEEVFEQVHEGADLFFGALPVLFAERIDREGFDPEATAGANDATHRRRAFFVASAAGETALLGPTAVAVHDDADVARESSELDGRGHGVLD